jgi:hypothetical protein
MERKMKTHNEIYNEKLTAMFDACNAAMDGSGSKEDFDKATKDYETYCREHYRGSKGG